MLLSPLFLAGLLAIAVPVLVHLTDRDRRDVVRFPSLKFLTRLPYRQERLQRLRHPFLFALRTLAIVLLVLAFARPLLDGAAATAGGDVARDVVIALDRSYSMAYGDTWDRAVQAARDAVGALQPSSRVSLLTFDETATVSVAPTMDRQVVTGMLDTLSPGPGRTRLAPLLQLADEVLLEAPSEAREVVLVSDFQANAWDRSSRTRLVPGVRLTQVDVSTQDPANVMIAGVEMRRAEAEDGPATVLNVRLVNQGPHPVSGLAVTVALGDQVEARGSVDLPPAGGATVALGPVEPPAAPTRATVRIASDALEADNAFHLVLSARPALPVLLIEASDARDDAALYLREALAIAEEPSFEVLARGVHQARREDVEASSLVILHDSPMPDGDAGRALLDHVAAGGGLWVVLGRRSTAPPPGDLAALLPGSWRETVDRLDVRGVSLASVDYDYPVFAVFSGPNAGTVTGARFYRYRPIVLDENGPATAVARYTDGAVALAERRHGDGRVLMWGSPLDNRWNNLPVQSVFLPFVHRVCRFLSGQRSLAPWHVVGEALDLAEVLTETEGGTLGVEAPSGSRQEIDLDGGEAVVTLAEAGFYGITTADGARVARPLAVNADRTESDLTRLDVEAFIAASTSAPDPAAPAVSRLGSRGETREERERHQRVWWFLVLAALLLLAAESVLSNRTVQG